MDFQTLQAELRRLGGAAQALAAIGATLRLRQTDEQAHPAVEARLRAVVEALLPGTLDRLDRQQVSAALAHAAFLLEDAMELFQNPARPPAWVIRDPAMLQAQGEASRLVFRSILALAADRPALAATLAGRFLDVGTGVGAIALEAAEQCPTMHVVGFDIWEPALVLARANIAASPHGARIEIRTQDVTQLDEPGAYSLVWLPAPFLSLPAAEAALDRLVAALAPGGHLVVGFYDLPADKVAAALAALRMARSGGHVWDSSALEQQLRTRGLVDVESCPGPPSVTLVIGRRP
jgi:methylase of polypeptide subunit release factors